MSVAILMDEFLKLDKSEQINFGRFVLDNLFSDIEKTESVLTKEQQIEVEKRYEGLKNDSSKGMSLTDFKSQMNDKYGI